MQLSIEWHHQKQYIRLQATSSADTNLVVLPFNEKQNKSVKQTCYLKNICAKPKSIHYDENREGLSNSRH